MLLGLGGQSFGRDPLEGDRVTDRLPELLDAKKLQAELVYTVKTGARVVSVWSRDRCPFEDGGSDSLEEPTCGHGPTLGPPDAPSVEAPRPVSSRACACR